MEQKAPCATKSEIGALFDEFMSRSQPLADLSSPSSPSSVGSISPARGPCPIGNPLLNFAPPAHTAAAVPSPFQPTLPKRKLSSSAPASTNKKAKTVKPAEEDMDDALKSKKARRRKQNRVAAQTSREKKKRYLSGLEQKVSDLQSLNKDLMAKLEAAQKENQRLKASHNDSGSVAAVAVNSEAANLDFSFVDPKLASDTPELEPCPFLNNDKLVAARQEQAKHTTPSMEAKPQVIKVKNEIPTLVKCESVTFESAEIQPTAADSGDAPFPCFGSSDHPVPVPRPLFLGLGGVALESLASPCPSVFEPSDENFDLSSALPADQPFLQAGQSLVF